MCSLHVNNCCIILSFFFLLEIVHSSRKHNRKKTTTQLLAEKNSGLSALTTKKSFTFLLLNPVSVSKLNEFISDNNKSPL